MTVQIDDSLNGLPVQYREVYYHLWFEFFLILDLTDFKITKTPCHRYSCNGLTINYKKITLIMIN